MLVLILITFFFNFTLSAQTGTLGENQIKVKKVDNKVPLALQLNRLFHQRLGTLSKLIEKAIHEDSPEDTLKKIGEHHQGEDRVAYLKVLKEIKKSDIKIRSNKRGFVIVAAGEKLELEIIDYLALEFKVNGTSFHYRADFGFKKNYHEIVKLLRGEDGTWKKATYLILDFFFPNAHAAIPVVLAAAGVATVIFDAVGSPYVNTIMNTHDQYVMEKIALLEVEYMKRADECESDLARSHGMGQSQLEGLSSIRVVSSLISELNADLYNRNGREQINYNNYSCRAYHRVHGIRNRNLIGIVSFGPGSSLRELCHQQDRLNRCFSAIEDVMRENNLQVNDISRPDPGNLADVILEYQDLDEVKRINRERDAQRR